MSGADFLCYVTPAEHLGLPDINDVREGVIAARIAGHAADVAKGLPKAVEWDLEMAKARKNLDWKKQIVQMYTSKQKTGSCNSRFFYVLTVFTSICPATCRYSTILCLLRQIRRMG